MSNEILSTLTETTKTALAPVQKLNKLAVANVETLSEIGTANLRVYADLVITQLTEVLEITDVDGVKTFADKQGAMLKILGEMALADLRTLAQMGVDFNTAAREIVQESLAAASHKAA